MYVWMRRHIPVLMCAQPSHQIDQPIYFICLPDHVFFLRLIGISKTAFPPVANRRRGPKASTNLLLGTLHVSLCRSRYGSDGLACDNSRHCRIRTLRFKISPTMIMPAPRKKTGHGKQNHDQDFVLSPCPWGT